jgi:hypothetical protein
VSTGPAASIDSDRPAAVGPLDRQVFEAAAAALAETL